MSNDIILILGARSDIGMAVAHRFGKAGYDIQLAARDAENLADDKSDLELRYGVSVSLYEFDALEIQSHELFVENLYCLPTVVVCAVGYMGNQLGCENSSEATSIVMRSNFEGPASILGVLAKKFELRGSGCLVGISSVAGERGRASNYVYGSAKAGFTAFLSGLRNRLFSSDVHVVTILPGFIDTKMTETLNLPSILTAQPNQLAKSIYISVRRSKDTVYHMKIWYFIMLIIRLLPEVVFKRTRF